MTETPDTGPSEADLFFQANGRATLNWQLVETDLFRFYVSLFSGGNLDQIGVAYYSLNSFGAKLNLVSRTAEAVCHEQRLKRWLAIAKELSNAADERNILAHRAVAIASDSGPDLALVLAPPYFSPKHLRRKLGKRYDRAECLRLAGLFGALAKKIETFCAQ